MVSLGMVAFLVAAGAVLLAAVVSPAIDLVRQN
jgi:hypothetical protein